MLGVDKKSLQAQVREVQACRTYMAELTTQHFEAKKKLEQTPEWLEVERIKALSQPQGTRVSQQEEALRSMALVAYRENGDKAPVAGVTVKQYKHLVYDTAIATEWCKANAPALIMHTLSPDYGKVAENLPGAPIEVVYEPRVQIAKDLGKAVAE